MTTKAASIVFKESIPAPSLPIMPKKEKPLKRCFS
jgi:hypothetical protein